MEEDKCFKLFNTQVIYVPSVNGVLDGDMMSLEIERFMKESVKENADDLVDIIVEYPEQEFTKVTMRTDCYIMSKKHFDYLMDKIYK